MKPEPEPPTLAEKPLLRLVVATALGLLLARTATAQPAVSVTLPPSLILPNYDRVQIGQREGLEAGTFVARTNDAAANWYNPAGLVLSEKSALNASAVAYEWTTLSVEGLGEKTTRSRFSSLSTLVAGVIGAPIIGSDRWRLGFSATTPISWAPGAIDDAFETPVPGGTERMAYNSQVELSQFVPAASAGYAVRHGVRLGLTAAFSWTSLNETQGFNDRVVTTDSAKTLLRNFNSDGSVLHAIFTLGAQWDFAPHWTAGAVVTSPGARLWGQSQLVFDGTVLNGTGTGDLYFRDEAARFDYRHPVRVGAGISHQFDRGAIEVDLRYHGSTSQYSMLSSEEHGKVTFNVPGNPPRTEDVRYQDTLNEARGVWNWAAGGHYAFTKAWTGHLGFFSDTSPVADPDSSILRKANLLGVTAGASLQGTHLSGSLGIGVSFGDSGMLRLASLATGQAVSTKVSVRSASLVYAVAYSF